MASLNQFGPVRHAWQIDSISNSVACLVTSNLEFEQNGCVIEIEWTKDLCNNCQPNALHYSIQ